MQKHNENKLKGAVALGYNAENDNAPKLLAKGKGDIAEEILEIAMKNQIIVRKDEILFRSLYELEVGSEIPIKFYNIIAELIAFVYKINDKMIKKERK